mgnify:FL=1
MAGRYDDAADPMFAKTGQEPTLIQARGVGAAPYMPLPGGMMGTSYVGMGNENRGNPFLKAKGRLNPMTGQMEMVREEDPGIALDTQQGKQPMMPPLTPPAFKSGAAGGFNGLEQWLGKYGEHPSPYPNLATDPWLGR